MVSLWPWRGTDNSPASFEKTLSALSGKITESQSRLDRLRSSSRRFRVLWTLYLGFAYLVYAILLLVVVGYQNLGVYEWTGLAGGPVFIIAGRQLAGSYYTFRIDSLNTRLQDYQSERAKTIQKLKDATKYDSTLELIEKYGGEQQKKEKEKAAKAAAEKKAAAAAAAAKNQDAQSQQQSSPNRTHMAPPPTANIQPRNPSPLSNGPSPAPAQSPSSLEPGAEFAPNAYAAAASPPPPPPFAQNNNMAAGAGGGGESHWYDRVFDVLLGEDETAAKNRIVLLCSSCKLVNGQAPPGTRSLAEVGVWRCMACHAKNGVENEGKRIMEEVLGSKDNVAEDEQEQSVEEGEDIPEGEEDVAATGADGPAAGVKKRRAKAK